MLFLVIMNLRGVSICVVILLFVGMAFTPVTGSIFEADDTTNYGTKGNDDIVELYFWDCTVKPLEKTVVELTESEWIMIQDELREIRTTSESIEESFNAQFALFKSNGFIEYDVDYETLEQKAMEEFEGKNPRTRRQPLLDNVILNAMCAINFELDSSSNTFVFGLNTFVNLIGFDIVSVHKGYSPDGIEAIGVLGKQTAEAGEYLGFMFGFLGYWAGTKTGTGTYSDLVVAGFSVTTTWFPLPSR